MAAVLDQAPATGPGSSGCLPRLLSGLNPLSLYDPRVPCGQGTFLWGIAYPLLAVFLVYTGVMVSAYVAAALLHREPSSLIDQAGFARVVTVILAGSRLILGSLMVVRRTRDLGWSWLVALVWLVVAIATLQSAFSWLARAASAIQVVLLLALLFLPGRIARRRRATPGQSITDA
jgi:uncharacterized membrane protein YhaH (DUF805 family)